MAERDLDIVVFGASGFTGRLVAAHLALRAGEEGIRWAAAARDRVRLIDALGALGVSAPETIEADVNDAGSLASMAGRATVVLNMVGPYARYGRPVIEACIACGAHYVDLTGEMPFVRTIIDELGSSAEAAAVKVVQVCGFESLPPDMLVALAAAAARERWDEPLAEVDLEVHAQAPPGMPRLSDAVSGGTFQSIALLAGAEDSSLIVDPAALIPDETVAAGVRAVSPIGLLPRGGPGRSVLAPMAPAPFINPGVIHRSAMLSDAAQGRAPHPFRYRESTALDGGTATLPARWAAAGALSAAQYGLRGLARARPSLRAPVSGLLSRIGPSSGFGPAADRMEGWTWTMTVSARTASGNEVTSRVDAEGHPGYLATARMLAEAGIMLAADGLTPALSGCLTPSAALGTAHTDRFGAARVRFTVAP